MKINNFIENEDTLNNLMFKHSNNEILNNSALVVKESEVAILVRDGLVTNIFQSGKYTLNTKNYPDMFNVKRKLFEKVSTASVYFMKMTDFIAVEWGTDSPIQMVDSKYGFTIAIRANGVFSFRISNPSKLLIKLIGLDAKWYPKKTLEKDFKSIFVPFVKNEIAKYIKQNNLSVMDLSTEYFNIASSIQNNLEDVCEDYGIKLVNFYIKSISIDENDENYKKINSAIVQKNIYNLQGDAWKDITKAEIDKSYASNSNLMFKNEQSTFVNNPFVNNSFDSKICPACKKPNSKKSSYCKYCGEKLGMAKYCSRCGKELSSGVKFCSYCGNEVKE